MSLTQLNTDHYPLTIEVISRINGRPEGVSLSLLNRLAELTVQAHSAMGCSKAWSQPEEKELKIDNVVLINQHLKNLITKSFYADFVCDISFELEQCVDGTGYDVKTALTIHRSPKGLKLEDINIDPAIGWVHVDNKLPQYTASHPDGINPARVRAAYVGKFASQEEPGARYLQLQALYGCDGESEDFFYTRSLDGEPLVLPEPVVYWKIDSPAPVIPYAPVNGLNVKDAIDAANYIKKQLSHLFQTTGNLADTSPESMLMTDDALEADEGYQDLMKETTNLFAVLEEDLGITLSDTFKVIVESNVRDVYLGDCDWELAGMSLNYNFLIH